jgi:hypothetical protein
MITRIVIAVCLCSSPAFVQDPLEMRVMTALRAATAPALPFSDTDRSSVVPADGKTEPLWMVRPPEGGEQMFEVIANPLNEANQRRAARAMAQIQSNVESAQRRAAAQYDRAVAEAKRTGKSQEVDGVTLADEGVAGAKIDADSHVAIEVAFNQSMYRSEFSCGTVPHPSVELAKMIAAGGFVVVQPSNIYRDVNGVERFCEGETIVYLGRVSQPVMNKRADSDVYDVHAAAEPPAGDRAAAVSSLVVRFRGNEALTADLLRKTNWNVLLELLK